MHPHGFVLIVFLFLLFGTTPLHLELETSEEPTVLALVVALLEDSLDLLVSGDLLGLVSNRL